MTNNLRKLAFAAACAALLACAGSAAARTAEPETATRAGAFCTAAQKRSATNAHAKFKKAMPARTRAYFKRVRNAKKRAAFLKAQRAKLKKLKTRASCRVRVPVRPSPPSPPPPPPSPRPPSPPPSSPPLTGVDLLVTMTPDRTEVGLHATVGFRVEVTNRGPDPAAGVVVVDALPAALRRVSADFCPGVTTIRCDLGTVYPNETRTITIRLRPLAVGSLTHQVSATTSTTERVPSDNSAQVALTVSPLPTFSTPPDTGFSFQLERPWFADDTSGTTFPWVGEWPKTAGVFQSGTGTLRGAVIFVDFPDYPGSASVSMEESLDLLETDSKAWYREASYGRLTLELESAGGWYRMSKTAAEYGISQCCSLPNARAFVTEAIAKADPHFDFGAVDALWVIGASGASQQMTILIDQTWPGAGINVDGRELRRWITAPALFPSVPTQIEPARFASWIVTHEIGHFLGLPDLYLKPPGCPPCPNTFGPVGYWDQMSDTPLHAHVLAWHKWLVGWLDRAQLRELSSPGSLEVTLTPLAAPGGLKAVVVPLTPSTAYVVEARAPLGWESGLCDRGVLVYTVDSTKRNAEGPVHIVPAHGATTSSTCGPIFDAPFSVGPGEVSTFEDSAVKVEVLEALADGSYHVRVTKK